VNLTFYFEKKINAGTFISWNQDGRPISNISKYEVKATKANLKFQYSIDNNWSEYTSSLNSEINVYLNGNPYQLAIKLIDVNVSSFEWADINLSPPVDSVNLSIEVLIKDNFGLNEIITISIDNVTLDISYIIYYDLPPSDGGGGGGGTKYIRGPDYTPIIIALVTGIIALVTFFGVYQKH
jgi:hypothetical protein